MKKLISLVALGVFLSLGLTLRGDIAYVSTGNHIEEYSSSGHDLGAFYTGASNWAGIDQMAFSPTTGDLYATYVDQNGNSDLLKIAPNGTGTTIATSIPGHDTIAVDSSGRIDIGGFGFIERYSSSGTNLGPFVTGLGDSSIKGLAFDSSGNLYADSFNQNEVLQITPGGSTSNWASVSAPFGAAFDSSGRLYVTGNNTVVRLASNGAFQTSFGSGGFNGAEGEAFGSGGQLFVTETNSGSVVEWTSPGSASPARSVFISGLTSPQDIVFTNDAGQPLLLPGGVAVPETSTWLVSALAAMMLSVQIGRAAVFSKRKAKVESRK